MSYIEQLFCFVLFLTFFKTECPPGRWGDDCSQACVCEQGAGCNHITGECECPAGFGGEKCETSKIFFFFFFFSHLVESRI